MKKNAFILLIISLLGSANCAAETPEEKGQAIANELDKRNQGYADSTASMTMTLIDEQGKTEDRELEVKTLEVNNDKEGDKAMLVFNQPRDVAGTALLTLTQLQDNDEQWLYLPALKRTKRISSSNKTGSFMASEFSYEDMVPFEIKKYHYKFLREEACGSLKCFVVEVYPNYQDSGYKRLINWIDTSEYRSQKIEFYDTSDTLLKTLTADGYQQYLEHYWRPAKLTMVNHQNNKSTKLSFTPYRFKTGMKDEDFSQSSLQRGR